MDGSFWCLRRHTFLTTANKTQVPPEAENIIFGLLLAPASILQSRGVTVGKLPQRGEDRQSSNGQRGRPWGHTCMCHSRYFCQIHHKLDCGSDPSRLGQERRVQADFSLKPALGYFPRLPHPLLIRGGPGLTCPQGSVGKLIIILLWKIRKSFRLKYQIPQNHMWQLLGYACGGGNECVKILTLSLSAFWHRKEKEIRTHIRQKPMAKRHHGFF